MFGHLWYRVVKFINELPSRGLHTFQALHGSSRSKHSWPFHKKSPLYETNKKFKWLL